MHVKKKNKSSEYSSESGLAEQIVEEQVCDTTNDGDNDMNEDIKWANDNIEDDPNDDWGNFEDVGGDNVAESQSSSHLQAEPASAADKPDIEFDESDDDEFGDFGEATTTVPAVEPVRVDPGDESSILKSLELLSVKSEELLRSIFETSVGDEHEEQEEKDEMNLEKTVLVEGGLFSLMEDPASCPALDHQWRDSSVHNIIMNTLGVDSRVLLDGEGWRSSMPKYAPKNAATLMTPGGLLTPELATNNEDVEKKTESASVSPAEFDWSNSGLTDPLAADSGNDCSNKVPKSPAMTKPREDNNNHGAKSASLSREAQNVLDGLPLLNFMSSRILGRSRHK